MSKLDSLNHIISTLQPSVITLQETKLRKSGKLNSKVSKDYVIFELCRKDSHGGGLATIVKKSLNPVFISEGNDQEEILNIQIQINEIKIRILNCYGPQECSPLEKKNLFWSRLHNEVNNAIEEGLEVIVQFDGNLHLGQSVISGDPDDQNQNGKMFKNFLENNQSIVLLNATSKCHGTITRARGKGEKYEESVLDFILVSDNLLDFVESMVIDEKREFPLSSYLRGKITHSDHFTEILNMNIEYNKQKPVREEVYNFKSIESLNRYSEILNNENNLIKCFDTNEDIETQVENWLIAFDNILKKSFTKTRVTNKIKETDVLKLQKERTELVQKSKLDPENDEIKKDLEKVTDNITKLVSEKNRDKLYENFKDLDQTEGGTFANGIWSIKKRVFPKQSANIPAAKTDINGKSVTNPDQIKNIYLTTFQHRLRNRPPKESYAKITELEEILCETRLLITREAKSPDWTKSEIIAVLKTLKSNKAKDPLGFCNEIFQIPVAGDDLIESLVAMMNKVKNDMKIPDIFRMKNITPIFKGKGSRADPENDRGVFNCTILNSIFQKLILQSNYQQIDDNLTDSNVGSRKNKNIRNNTFIVNAVILEANANKLKSSLDIQIYDYRQAFDALSVTSTLNDLYNVGVTSNHLNLINECDSKSNIAVKTPCGITKRVVVKKVVAQGEPSSSIKCTVSVDAISESHVQNLSDHLYQYRMLVAIPVLGMVDDQINMAKCGLDSLLSSAHINCQTNLKKLQFNASKSFRMHIGKNENICPQNMVDTWTLSSDQDTVSSVLEMFDKEGDQKVLVDIKHEKYLGDVIMSSGSNSLNIQARVNRGYAAVNQISDLLEELYLGKYHFEAGNVLRASLLLSTLLSNSEAWFNLTEREIEDLERVDEALLRKIYYAHSKTSRELLYLESGNVPIRFILKSRRLNFLFYILHENEESLLRKVFDAQNNNPLKGDWVTTAKNDINELELNMTFDEIRTIDRKRFKTLVKNRIQIKALEYLLFIKSKHSKGKELSYDELELQNYLSSKSNLSIKEKSFIFSCRTRMLDVKSNFKTGQNNLNCDKCGKEEETQRHILTCSAISSNSEISNHDIPLYEHLFCSDLVKIASIGKIMLNNFIIFKNCTNVHRQTPSAATYVEME